MTIPKIKEIKLGILLIASLIIRSAFFNQSTPKISGAANQKATNCNINPRIVKILII